MYDLKLCLSETTRVTCPQCNKQHSIQQRDATDTKSNKKITMTKPQTHQVDCFQQDETERKPKKRGSSTRGKKQTNSQVEADNAVVTKRKAPSPPQLKQSLSVKFADVDVHNSQC